MFAYTSAIWTWWGRTIPTLCFPLALLLPSGQTSTNKALSTCIFTFSLIAGKKGSAATVSRIIRTNTCNYIWSCFSRSVIKVQPFNDISSLKRQTSLEMTKLPFMENIVFSFPFSLLGCCEPHSWVSSAITPYQRRRMKIKENPILPNEWVFL